MDVDVSLPAGAPPAADVLTDAELVKRILAGDRGLFEILMRRHNQRLYRAARAVMGDEAEIEDIMQQAYMNAFAHLDQFESRSELSTWLTRIVLNEAFARLASTSVMETAAAAISRSPKTRQSWSRLRTRSRGH